MSTNPGDRPDGLSGAWSKGIHPAGAALTCEVPKEAPRCPQ